MQKGEYCSLVTEVEYICDNFKAECMGETDGIKFDYIERNESNDSFEFWYDDNIVCRIYCNEYKFYVPESSSEKGRLLHFASIRFNSECRSYDYLCEIDDVNVGDMVVVIGYDGETEVEVTSVFEKYEGELGIPLERYKKIIRKL